MSLKLLRVEDVWVDRIIALADGPWTRQDAEARFADWGWHAGAAPEWGAGAAEPYEREDPDGEVIGWRLELGPAPPDPAAAVVLLCALCWPAFGEDPEDGDTDDIDGDYGADWQRVTAGCRAGFHRERDRLRDLVTARIGQPDEVVAGGDDTFRAVWRRGDRAVVLATSDDINSYSHYDVLVLAACGGQSGWLTGALE